VRPIDAIASGFLPTPTTRGTENAPSMQKWPAHRRLAEMLPTPTAQLYGSNQGGAAGRTGKKRLSLEGRVKQIPTPTTKDRGYQRSGGCKGKEVRGSVRQAKEAGYCPLGFREWMMGWPIGWTALEPLGTDRFQLWLSSHGGFSATG
jgi:hypothetical protein